jgi:hypothetical protein
VGRALREARNEVIQQIDEETTTPRDPTPHRTLN